MRRQSSSVTVDSDSASVTAERLERKFGVRGGATSRRHLSMSSIEVSRPSAVDEACDEDDDETARPEDDSRCVHLMGIWSPALLAKTERDTIFVECEIAFFFS